MKKSESISRKETPEEELKRLRKENKSLKSNLDKTKDILRQSNVKLKQTKAELKKYDTKIRQISLNVYVSDRLYALRFGRTRNSSYLCTALRDVSAQKDARRRVDSALHQEW